MNLLCRLGWHLPAPTPRWHAGLYVSRCLRCGADLVRMPGGRWRVPEAARVLRRPPEHERGGPDVAPDPVAPDEAPADSMAEAVEAAPAEAQPVQAEAEPTAQDPSFDVFGDAVSPSHQSAHVDDDSAAAAIPPPTDAPGDLPPPAEERRRLRRLWPVAAVAAVGGLAGATLAITLLAGLAGRTSASPPPSPPPPAASAPVAPPALRDHAGALVTGDRGGCSREERERLRRYRHGAPDQQVRIVDQDGHWVTLTRAGTSCWTLRTGQLSGSTP